MKKSWLNKVNPKTLDSRGFTLVEVMVVVGLLVFMGFLSSSFDTNSWLANSRLKGAARDLASNMQKARMNAIKENRTWGLLFDPATDTYRFQTQQDDGTWVNSTDPAIDLTNQYGSGVSFGQGAATAPAGGSWGDGDGVTFGNERATFNPKGFGTGGYCYLTNGENGAYAVGSLSSGAVRVRRWLNNAWK
jgi:type IV fimbrial biogenesis protein FimT